MITYVYNMPRFRYGVTKYNKVLRPRTDETAVECSVQERQLHCGVVRQVAAQKPRNALIGYCDCGDVRITLNARERSIVWMQTKKGGRGGRRS